ncbi:hypothetical protein [Intestinimonas sp. MSJ-38]|uniref:hypothetical protein n=1 Tax=Intestinimonas sp. MSJ-38 TaxID=2841532 RepID=UPI001C115796|nr:hypothetical protein [Intestinimonas sp. MSJ-38]MBU5431218.1 hypothetical protein [Intestinimonas sp. MSJ-38]
MKRKWIAAVSVCLCLVAVGVLYTKGPEESPAPASPEAKQTEQPEKEKPVLEIEPAAFSSEEQHYAWQQWQFDYACPSGWESRPMEVWEASENQEASPEWGVELVPPGKEEWAIRLQGSHRNQNLGVPLQESVEIYCAGEKIGRLDTGEKEGEVWKLVTLDQPGTAGSAFQIFIRGEEYWPEGEKLLAGFAA